MESTDNNGLYKKALKSARGGGFTYLKDSLVNKNGYKEYWDAAAKAPYLFNAEKKIFISYDNERSVKEKCKYVKQHHLAALCFGNIIAIRKNIFLRSLQINLSM